MFQLLLIIIYLSFISLGLPDSLLGSAWPTIYPQLDVPVSYAGIISMIVALGTIVSSLQSDRLTRRLGTGKVTAVSVAMTAVALWGFSVSNAFWQLCLWAVPYGLGAGSVDASLNNYVALHYKSKHMSWLHCMWGVGAASGPYIMGYVMTSGGTWNAGYRTISGCGVIILFLPLGATASLVGFVVIGLGCAPIYPCIIHSTPAHFGADRSQAIIGVQMACAYVGTCLMPPLFGLLAQHISVSLLPVYLLVILVLMAVMHESLIRKIVRNRQAV